MTERIPDEGTIEYVDYLIAALVEEAIMYGQMGSEVSTDAIDFHVGMLRAAYLRALERKAGDAGDET